jgi:uncharacterized protein YpuA (DUF1002 family)
MNIKKTAVVASIIGLVAIGGFALTKTFAANAKNGTSFVQSLAQKIGVDESKLNTAMSEVKDEERQTQLEESLSKAVSDGVITEDQKQSVIDKQKEIEQKQKELLENMKNWAKDNNIDYTQLQKYLGRGFGEGNRKGNGMPMPANDMPVQDSSAQNN